MKQSEKYFKEQIERNKRAKAFLEKEIKEFEEMLKEIKCEKLTKSKRD